LRYLRAAQRDLDEIFLFIARRSQSSEIALNFVDSIDEKCRHLAELPIQVGRPRPEVGTDFRSFVFKGYLIFFRYTDEALEVVSVVHGARDLASWFSDRLDD
jgi:plasmid stabilization system protein ParE